MKYSRDLILQVKELMERYDVYEIAHKMHMDPYTIQAIVDFINGLLT